jgi:uncharacterized protein YbdZ (MbtH family)
MQRNCFDKDSGNIIVLTNDEERQSLRPDFAEIPAGRRWFTANPTALRAWATLNRTGSIYGRRVCARGYQRAGLSLAKWYMESDGIR